MKAVYKFAFIFCVAVGLLAAHTGPSWAGAPIVGPTASVSGVVNGGNIDWTVFFSPDENLFSDNPPNGVGGSLAVEFSFEVANGTLLPATIDHHPDFLEVIMGVPIINSGNDPYTGMVETGTQIHPGETSELATGTVDAIFAPLGSTYFTTGGPKEALTFSTTGTMGTVTYGGLIAQTGAGIVNIPTASVTVPEPASATLAGLGVLAFVGLVRSRRSA